MNLLDEQNANVQGSGKNVYAEVTVDRCSPFEIASAGKEVLRITANSSSSSSKSPKTGGVNDWYIYALLILCAGAAAGTGIAGIKRKKAGKR